MDTLVPITDDWRPVEPVATPIQSADRPVIWVLAAIVGAQVAIFAYVVVAGFVRQPFSDMFGFLQAEFDWERTGDLLAYLTSLHNHQHLVWVRILTALDVQVFHGSATIFLAAAALSVLTGALVLANEIWRSTPVRMVGALAATLAVLLVVSTVNAMDCAQPINSVYAIAIAFTALAIILFERAGEAEAGHAALLATLALAAALAAAAGSGAGVAVFVVLVFSAVRNPGARRLIAPVLVVALPAIAEVVTALLDTAPAQAAGGGAGHLWKMADYFVVYAGMPWSAVKLLSGLRLSLGLATIAAGALLLWRGSRRHGAAGRLERIGLDLILFSVITAAMAAVGRVDENEAVIVRVRYAIFMSAFQVGVICVLAPALAERWASLKRYAVPGVLAAATALLVQQVAAGFSVLRTSAYIRSEITAFEAGARRPEMRQLIHPDFNVATQIEAECQKRGLYQ